MASAAFHILVALAEQDRHGYGIMLRVREQSGGRVPLRTGAFYRHLSRMIDDGLVAEAATRPADADPRRGTYYRLTPAGRRVAAAERTRLVDMIEASAVLSRAPRGGRA
jgi:DNA-binding PadR family transcriptional regulator